MKNGNFERNNGSNVDRTNNGLGQEEIDIYNETSTKKNSEAKKNIYNEIQKYLENLYLLEWYVKDIKSIDNDYDENYIEAVNKLINYINILINELNFRNDEADNYIYSEIKDKCKGIEKHLQIKRDKYNNYNISISNNGSIQIGWLDVFKSTKLCRDFQIKDDEIINNNDFITDYDRRAYINNYINKKFTNLFQQKELMEEDINSLPNSGPVATTAKRKNDSSNLENNNGSTESNTNNGLGQEEIDIYEIDIYNEIQKYLINLYLREWYLKDIKSIQKDNVEKYIDDANEIINYMNEKIENLNFRDDDADNNIYLDIKDKCELREQKLPLMHIANEYYNTYKDYIKNESIPEKQQIDWSDVFKSTKLCRDFQIKDDELIIYNNDLITDKQRMDYTKTYIDKKFANLIKQKELMVEDINSLSNSRPVDTTAKRKNDSSNLENAQPFKEKETEENVVVKVMRELAIAYAANPENVELRKAFESYYNNVYLNDDTRENYFEQVIYSEEDKDIMGVDFQCVEMAISELYKSGAPQTDNTKGTNKRKNAEKVSTKANNSKKAKISKEKKLNNNASNQGYKNPFSQQMQHMHNNATNVQNRLINPNNSGNMNPFSQQMQNMHNNATDVQNRFINPNNSGNMNTRIPQDQYVYNNVSNQGNMNPFSQQMQNTNNNQLQGSNMYNNTYNQGNPQGPNMPINPNNHGIMYNPQGGQNMFKI